MNDVFFLTCGWLWAPAAAVGPRGTLLGGHRLSLTVAVVLHPGGDVTLVDSGWSARTCSSPRRSIGWLSAFVLGVRVSPPDAIAAQLEALGIDRGRVRTIVLTHLHLDHAGGACDFPGAEVVCSTREHETFRRAGSPAYRAEDLPAGRRVRRGELDGPARLGSPRSHDVLGDGSVVLLDAQGHTAGHCAVLLASRRGPYVHIGDAADQAWEWRGTPQGPSFQAGLLAWNKGELLRTYDSLRACEAAASRPTLVPTHDHEIFNSLPHLPEGHALARGQARGNG